MLFNPINLPFWILLGIGIALFLMVILMGGGDDDADIEVGGDMDMDVDLDVDLDVDINIEADAPSLSLDADIDTDVDADADANADTEGNSQVLQVLSWLGVGKAPLVLLLAIDFSLWGLIGWMLNVILNVKTQGMLMGAVFLASLGLSLFSGGMISRPIGKVFASFGEDTSSERLIGCLGRVSSATLPVAEQGRIGQVDVFDPARNLVTVSAVLPKWAETLPRRGEEVLVIDRQDGVYVAISNQSADRDRWLNSASRHRQSS